MKVDKSTFWLCVTNVHLGARGQDVFELGKETFKRQQECLSRED